MYLYFNILNSCKFKLYISKYQGLNALLYFRFGS